VRTDAATGVHTYDHAALHAVACRVAEALDRIIDLNEYPVPEAERSNLRHRPIGLGVQDLVRVFEKMRLPFESEAALGVQREIFETLHHASVSTSVKLARLAAERITQLEEALLGIRNERLVYERRATLRSHKRRRDADAADAALAARETAVVDVISRLRGTIPGEAPYTLAATTHARWPGAYASFAGSPASEGALSMAWLRLAISPSRAASP
jgi:hypothetical protein